MTTYFISDTHFSHSNIIKYESRPFATVQEMDNEIVKRWNSVVKKSDTVIVLGDFALAPFPQVSNFCARLYGTKWLIMGNHDQRKSVNWWHKAGFAKVFEFPIIYKDFYILSHQPVYLNEATPYVNFHGHIHSKTLSYKGYVNCSVECINYTPISFEAIKKRLGVED